MFKIAFRGLRAHKFRVALGTFAVVLSVAFITGTYVLTDSQRSSFSSLFTEVFSTVDLSVRNPPPFGETIEQVRTPIPETLIDVVRGVPGVENAEGQIFLPGVTIIDSDGDAVSGAGPTFGTNAPAVEDLTPYVVKAGRWPTGPDEVVLDKATVDRLDFEIGKPVKITTLSKEVGTRDFTLVGAVGLGDADNFLGASIMAWELETAQVMLNRVGVFDEIFVKVSAGEEDRSVARAIEREVGTKYDVITGEEVTGENLDAINEFLGIFEQLLLAFALVGLFVGIFNIFNTFSMVVAQRTREMALLRALGASRTQVVGSIAAEAILAGLIASGLGIIAGYGLAAGLNALLERIGFSAPGTELVLRPSRIAIAFAVGVGVTLVSAVFPAARAANVAPLAAVRRSEDTANDRSWKRVAFGLFLLAAGALFLWVGLGQTGADKFQRLGVGALLIMLGVIALSTSIARAGTGVIGRLVRRGVTGELAYENAQRSPRRTGATASALMIGLAVVSLVFVLTASISKSIRALVESTFESDLVLSQEFNDFSPAVTDAVRKIDGVESIAAIRFGTIKVNERIEDVAALDANGIDTLIRLDVEGDIAEFDAGGLLVNEELANEEGWVVGDTVPVRFASSEDVKEQRPIAGIFRTQGFFEDYIISMSLYDEKFAEQLDSFALADLTDGRESEVRAEIEKLTKREFPNIKVQDREEFTDAQEQQVTGILFIFFALLGLSLLIAGIGVMNTMALSVFERTRELGLLRAVGMSRRQVRAMIRRESIVISIFGAVLGVAVGTVLGAILVSALNEFNIRELSIPPVQLFGVLVGSAFLGVIAALYPARRAARLDVLDAIAND